MCEHRRNIHVPVIVFGAKSAMNDKQDLLPNELLTSSAVLVVEIMRVLICSNKENKMQMFCQIHRAVHGFHAFSSPV